MNEETKPPTTSDVVTEQDKGRCALAPGSGHVIAGTRLRCLIANAHRMLGKKYKGSPLWAMVSDLTSHGSSISAEICTQAGYAPCQPCGVKELIAPNKQAEP